MGDVKKMLPDCGLYRTTQALPGAEDEVPAEALVYFHNHSDSGSPLVLPADHNVLNRWHFHGPGLPVRTLAWTRTLEKVPEQGFYALAQDLTFEGGRWPAGSIVQLGYTRRADPILFIAQLRSKLEENVLWFADRGVSMTRDRLGILQALSVYEEERRDDDEGGHLH